MKNSLSKMIISFGYVKKNSLETVSDYFSSNQSKVNLIILLILNLITWILAYLLTINLDQNLIFLHYNIIFGRDMLGPISHVYFWPIMGLGIIILNTIIILIINKKHKLLSQILLVASAISNVLLILALYSLYLVNFVHI